MYAIAFDLVVAEAVKHHPSHNPSAAYKDIKDKLTTFGFEGVQGSVYVLHNEDMSVLFKAIYALKAMTWFPLVVRDIRAFRIEQWSDFTATIKGN